MADNYPGKLTGHAADKRLEFLAIPRWYFLPLLPQAYPLSRAPLARRISP